MNKVNYLAVLVAAIVNWIIGGLWYSPLLFGNRFIALMGWTEQQIAEISSQSHMRELITAFVASLITSYVLSHIIVRTNSATIAGGIKLGLLAFIGFVLATSIETVLFEFRKPGLLLINNGYHLVGLMVMGGILGAWSRRQIVAPDLAYRKAAS